MILTIEKLNEIKKMSINNRDLLVQFIDEVEFGKIQKLLGTCVYNKIVEDVQSGHIDAELQSILDGGLYRAITYYVYARYIQESMLQDTFSGVRVKSMQDSNVASVGSLKNVAAEYNEMAYLAFSLVEKKIIAKYGTVVNTSDTKEYEIIGIRRDVKKKRCNCINLNYFD